MYVVMNNTIRSLTFEIEKKREMKYYFLSQ